MKKLSILSAFVILLAIFFITSCETEPLDSEIDLNDFLNIDDNQNSNNPNCISPNSLNGLRSMLDNTIIQLNWVVGGTESSWEIQYGNSGFAINNGTIVASNINSLLIENMSETQAYDFYVRANCSSTEKSNWVGPFTIDAIPNLNCIVPINFSGMRSASNNTTVDLVWNSGGTESSWEIQYGLSNFNLGSGTIVQSTTTSKSIQNISTSNAYQFYVRSVCSSSSYSSWIGPIEISSVNSPLPIIGYMNANVNGVQYNQMKPAFYTITGLEVGLSVNSNVGDDFKFLKIQGDSDPFFTTSSGVEINLYLSEEYWQAGTYVLKSDYDFNSTPEGYPYVDLIILEGTPVVYENEINGSITILEFNSVTKRIKGTFNFSYNTSDGSVENGPFSVTNGEFEFSLKDEVFE